MRITPVSQVDDALVEAFQRLIPQLNPNQPPPGRTELESLVASPACTLYVAYHPDFGNQIVGALTLILYRVPTGIRAYIEDVIVETQARGRGLGAALTQAAIEQAAQAGAASIGLTSNPAREAANRLYQRLGFELRKTNVYRLKLTGR